jgi:hypothetical protein
MTDQELEELARSVEDLKRAVKKNDPFLRSILASRGWGALAIFASACVTLFTLPAHFLSQRYGGFASIPPLLRAALWAVLAVFLIPGSIWKAVLLRRRAGEAEQGAGLLSILSALFGGLSFHMALPFFVATAVALGFGFFAGHPWLSAPAIAILVCFWINSLASATDRRDYLLLGWWSLLSGSAGLFFVERAPFVWLFIIYGGLCYLFTAETMLASILEGRRADGRQ